MNARLQPRRVLRAPHSSIAPPSRKLEYAYYAVLGYMVFAPAIGIELPLLAGAMILSLAFICFVHFRPRFGHVIRPITFLIATAVSFIVIQIAIHDGSPLDDINRAFVIWILNLVVVYSLCFRPGFTLRLPVVMLAIGLMTLPFLDFNPGEVEMAHAGIAVQGGLTHPGGFADWFGFCAVFFAILGTESKRPSFRMGFWVVAVGCLVAVTLAAERGPLFASALAITIGFRRLLRRGFIPVLVLVLLAGGIYASGLFQPAVSKYTERGFEETGREVLWPDAVDRISESPYLGVGEPKVNVYFYNKEVGPHNVFLHLALSAGVIPFGLFLAFWIRSGWKAVIVSRDRRPDPFQLPYLVYTLVSVMLGDWGFMAPWAIFTLSVGAGASFALARQLRTPVIHRTANRVLLRRSPFRPVNAAARYRF